MKKIDFKPIPLEEYLAFNVESRRGAFRLIRNNGYNRPRSAKEMMSILAEIRRNGDKEDLISIAKLHPDYELIKFAVMQEADENAEPETSNCSGGCNGSCGSGYSNCGGCAGMSSADGSLNTLLNPSPILKRGGAINGQGFDGTWLPVNGGGNTYVMSDGSSSGQKESDDRKFYTTLVVGTLLAGLFIVGVKSMN